MTFARLTKSKSVELNEQPVRKMFSNVAFASRNFGKGWRRLVFAFVFDDVVDERLPEARCAIQSRFEKANLCALAHHCHPLYRLYSYVAIHMVIEASILQKQSDQSKDVCRVFVFDIYSYIRGVPTALDIKQAFARWKTENHGGNCVRMTSELRALFKKDCPVNAETRGRIKRCCLRRSAVAVLELYPEGDIACHCATWRLRK